MIGPRFNQGDRVTVNETFTGVIQHEKFNGGNGGFWSVALDSPMLIPACDPEVCDCGDDDAYANEGVWFYEALMLL